MGNPLCPDRSHTPRENRRRVRNPEYPGFTNLARARFVVGSGTDHEQGEPRAEH